jgi:hypothetical protein
MPSIQATGGVLICLSFCLLIFSGSFSIAAIVLGKQEGVCDNMDPMGLKVADWLLGYGISGIVMVALLFLTGVGMLTGNAGAIIVNTILMWLNGLFGFAWFIVGAVILYRSNVDCIHVGVPAVCYAVFLWAWSAFNICCGSSTNKKRNDDN